MAEIADPPSVSVAFFDRNLLTNDRVGFPKTDSTPAPKASLVEPGLFRLGRNVCFSPLPQWFHQRERGLRWQYCRHDLNIERLKQTIALLREAPSQSAPPIVQQASLVMSARRASYFKKVRPLLVISHGGSSPEEFQSDSAPQRFFSGHHATAIRPGTWVPASFGASHTVLIEKASTHVLYPIPNSDFYLTVTINDPLLATRLRAALYRLPTSIADLRNRARPGKIIPGEVHLAGSEKEGFLELQADGAINATDGTPTADTVSIRIGSTTITHSLIAFANGVEVVELPKLTTDTPVEIESSAGGRTFSRATLPSTAKRSLQANDGFRHTMFCAGTGPCRNRGIREELFSPVDALATEYCQAEDLSLSEFNPFGIAVTSEDSLDSGGKFVEFKTSRDCSTEAIVFWIDDAALPAPTGTLKREQVLLFVGDQQLFGSPNRQVSTGLRAANSSSRIEVQDLLRKTQATLRPTPTEALYFPGGGPDRHFPAVHSLTPTSCAGETTPCEVYSATRSVGLRADLAAFNAMTPGHHNKEQSSIGSTFFLSELLPFGARRTDGSSVAGAEFVELSRTGAESDSAQLLELTINDGTIRRVRFPAPRGSHRLALVRDGSECFPGHANLTRLSGLVLPNRPALYSLRHLPGAAIDSFELTASLYAQAEGTPRHSITRVFDNVWRLASGARAVVEHCPQTFARPGAATPVAPFVTEGSDPFVARFIYYGSPTQLSASTIDTSGTSVALQSSPSSVTSGEAILVELPAHADRHLIRLANGSGDLLFSGDYFAALPQLFIDAVAPTPQPDQHEWLRVCSAAGFDLAHTPLILRDSSSADELVPWADRFGSVLSDGIRETNRVLEPGRCAVILDPDSTQLPETDARDAAIWTTSSGAALGNGLGSGEGLKLQDARDNRILATIGLPDSVLSFSVNTASGQTVRRNPGTYRDRFTNFSVRDTAENLTAGTGTHNAVSLIGNKIGTGAQQ